MTTTTDQVDNGVNVEALLGAREALTDQPEGAKFQWRATCKWIYGTQSQSTIKGFYGLGAEQEHKTEFTYDADHPEIFASEDKAATPVELVLAGLASCLTAGVAAVAQRREIQLRSVSATLEAGWTSRASSASTATCGTASAASRSATNIDADATPRGYRGDRGRAVPETLRGLRHRREPDQRDRRGEVSNRGA